ncbi:interleukin-20-like [Rana temporaria]|uniref:interleukin-20-like n=1 Tax=Rana temporaria TaxID=8407 RepID=UPI001AADBF66|nr:interleukin-20-like [Rana temporaria]
MESLSTGLLQLVIVIFLLTMPSSNGNKFHCPVTADIREFEKYFETLEEILHEKDLITDVSLLKTSELKQIQPSERCCFLLRLGKFYITNVFPEVESILNQQHQDVTHLANSILGVNKSLEECHNSLRCPCGAQSHAVMKKFKDDYFKMETEAAAIKAIGELNLLFHWMENHYLSL